MNEPDSGQVGSVIEVAAVGGKELGSVEEKE